MKTVPSIARYRNYGFECPQGKVEPHYILRHDYPWLKRPIKHILVETFSKEADMKIEIAIHWTNISQWMKKMWPHGGSVKAVLLETGERVYATSMHVGHDSNSYEAAPILCRDVFKIVTLDKSRTLIEVEGVGKWAGSKRDEAATKAFLDHHAQQNLPSYQEVEH